MRKFLILTGPAVLAVIAWSIIAEHRRPVSAAPLPAPTVAVTAGTSTLSIANSTKAMAMVYIAFGADSIITSWPACPTTSRLNCQMPLSAGVTAPMPLNGKYLNATISFNAPVTCNTTKAELNLNNPKWYDIADVSLVDGYSNNIEIDVGSTRLGPPNGKEDNEKVLGLFPLGCDICTARQNPPCGMSPGRSGCKAGTQYKPNVICQWQGSVKGGGTAVKVLLDK